MADICGLTWSHMPSVSLHASNWPLTLALLCERGILVDEYMQTNLPDIFAAGDVAQVSTRRRKAGAGQPVDSSPRTGLAAGQNMSGHNRPTARAVAFNVTRLAGLTTTIIGAVGSGATRTCRYRPRRQRNLAPNSRMPSPPRVDLKSTALRLMIGEKHILGAIVMGDQKLLDRPAKSSRRRRMDITAHPRALLTPKAAIGDILATVLVG